MISMARFKMWFTRTFLFFSFKSSNNSSVFEYPEKGEKFTFINCVLISYVMALFSSQCLLQVTLKLTKL